jgi:protein-tyrosine phosphatase
MIDTHLHILPGVDDGPETMQESLALAQILTQEGIHAAVATPHYNDEFPQRSAAEIRERVYDVQQELDRHSVPLRLFAGHEALIKPGLVEDIQSGHLATLNGSRYLLLELWNQSWQPVTERIIFELQAYGITPMLAHTERYRVFQEQPKRLAPLLRQGVLIQITASSLVGMHGRKAQRAAEALLRQELVYCIASDAHALHRRPPAIVQGVHRAVQLIGQVRTQQLIEGRPMTIINDVPCRL